MAQTTNTKTLPSSFRSSTRCGLSPASLAQIDIVDVRSFQPRKPSSSTMARPTGRARSWNRRAMARRIQVILQPANRGKGARCERASRRMTGDLGDHSRPRDLELSPTRTIPKLRAAAFLSDPVTNVVFGSRFLTGRRSGGPSLRRSRRQSAACHRADQSSLPRQTYRHGNVLQSVSRPGRPEERSNSRATGLKSNRRSRANCFGVATPSMRSRSTIGLALGIRGRRLIGRMAYGQSWRCSSGASHRFGRTRKPIELTFSGFPYRFIRER